MEISRIIAELGPQLIARELESAREQGDAQRVAFFENVAPELCNAAADGFSSYEKNKQAASKAQWVAETAAHMLMHHQGEVMDADVDDAVRIAKRIMDQAERAFSK